ncbi:MAG: BlaI/MecI/CopY family transcriptional regulator [Thermoplasmata archaeon]|nr:BlaI/MecI/CopY family transcriptional regulator [Thermoplasmata archaeon]
MIEKIEKKVANIMRHYGLGEAEAKVMGALATRGEMSAKEISSHTGYAYSTVINTLNFLKRMGMVERRKKGRTSFYSAEVDFLEMMKEERERILNIFHELKEDMNSLKKKSREKMRKLVESVEKSIRYMKHGEGI